MTPTKIIKKKIQEINDTDHIFKIGDKVITYEGLITEIAYIGNEYNEYAVGLRINPTSDVLEGYTIFEVKHI